MTHETHECGRCEVRDRTVRLTVADLLREARLDRRLHEGSRYATEYRCAACRDAVRPRRVNQ